ncbi:transposase [Streptomyces canus]|uniref:transposase n=1 Tax=Streptomyces canus TaxID=58343 RepID=UPI0032490F8F
MTDAEWVAGRPLLPVPAWFQGRGGRPEGYCHRQQLDAIRYLVAGGISLRAVPADFPAWARVYTFFRRWREHGLIAEFHDRLRGTVRDPWIAAVPTRPECADGPAPEPSPAALPARAAPSSPGAGASDSTAFSSAWVPAVVSATEAARASTSSSRAITRWPARSRRPPTPQPAERLPPVALPPVYGPLSPAPPAFPAPTPSRTLRSRSGNKTPDASLIPSHTMPDQQNSTDRVRLRYGFQVSLTSSGG